MKHLITGGSGFLGNLIMKQLLNSGEEVKILDIWKSQNHPNKNKIFYEGKFVNKLYFILLLIIPVTLHSFILYKLSLSSQVITMVINLLFLILILVVLMLITNNRNDVSFSSKEKLLDAFKKIPLMTYILVIF